MVYMKHPAMGGAAYFPDEDGVVEWHEARGWEKADEPDAAPFVPPPGDAAPVEDEWVKLIHKETGAVHDFPNNPEALEGAYDAGWQHPQPEKPAKAVKKTASVKASAEPATDDNKDEGVTTSG